MSDDTQLDKEDAERFRWIMKRYATHWRKGWDEWRLMNSEWLPGKDFREAIDNAMERAKQEGGK